MPRPTPPPLPPERRTVGQLVAETIHAYGERFWRSLALGVPIAVEHQLAIGRSLEARVLLLAAFAPVFALTAAAATALVRRETLTPHALGSALAAGTVVFLPAAFFFPWFLFASVAWLALVGLAVPVVVAEQRGPWQAIVRATRLARADYVHAAGSLATLVLIFGLVRVLLVQLLHAQADNTLRAAALLGDLLLSPLLFLGAAMLYYDQEARSRIGRGEPVPRR
jgi:hypothetical protein